MVTTATRTHVRLLALVVVLALAISAALASATASAATVYPYQTPGYFTVCAESLTHHTTAGDVTLHTGHDFYADGRFGDGINHVWGYNQGGRYGWVLNGWFC